jgi:predicted acetyltransferase
VTHAPVDNTDLPVVLDAITRESATLLNNLFELYAYDFSEQVPLELDASGRFGITPGEVWWTRDDHFPYLIRQGGKLTGFALARRGSRVTSEPDVMDVAEFFVLRGARGTGVGRRAAHALFGAFPGAWEVRVRRSNVAALRFWSRAAEAWANQPVTSQPVCIDGVDWDVLRFGKALAP